MQKFKFLKSIKKRSVLNVDKTLTFFNHCLKAILTERLVDYNQDTADLFDFIY